MRLNLPVTNHELVLADEKTIVSTTDLSGKITYANPYFVEISGFSEQELIGADQNIVRHPDMPVEAFADLWTTIKSGLPWSGLVKNRCKDGDHYWVMANVTPVIENGKTTGYMSVRTKPTCEQITQATQLYQRLQAGNPDKIRLQQGQAVRAGWRSKIAAYKNISLSRRIAINMSVIIVLLAAEGLNVLYRDAHSLSGILLLCAAAMSLYFWLSLHTSVVQPLRDATTAAKILAGGDLTGRPVVARHDDFGQLMLLLRQLNINLASIIGDVRSNFVQITTSTHEVSVGNMDLSARTEAQASNLEETSASMEELAATVQNNSTNAAQANAVASNATGIAEKTGITVAHVVAAMSEINSSSKKIGDIIGLIDSIAFQTNILALNAAVEAARAGEQGRGFAVVASEVRNLAQKSASAAKDIKNLIETSGEKIRAGSYLADEAGKNMNEVIHSIKQVADLVQEISLATQEQSAGINQVKDAVVQMDEVTQQNAAMVEEVAASANILEEQALEISAALQVFKLEAAKAKQGASIHPLPAIKSTVHRATPHDKNRANAARRHVA